MNQVIDKSLICTTIICLFQYFWLLGITPLTPPFFFFAHKITPFFCNVQTFEVISSQHSKFNNIPPQKLEIRLKMCSKWYELL